MVATAAEVAGLAYWLHLWESGSRALGFIALVAGEAVEWSLLAALIVSNANNRPAEQQHVGAMLAKTASIIFSESLLWICWLALMPYAGFATSTLLLLLTMHAKHGAAVSVYTGRPISEDIFDVSSIAASVLEVCGAAIFYTLFQTGQAAAGIAILGLCITVEHTLQFRSAGIFNPKGAHPAFS
ncbi:MAG: hypothetical protein JO228_01060 [Xanthobacteraceae bacterium]|nr:hypothetical protein [Xanthobacteraceae bacterium]